MAQTQNNIDPLNATLIERRDVHEDLTIFRVRYDDGRAIDFEPGQVVSLGLVDPDQAVKANSPRARRGGVKLIRRAYSIASPPPKDSQTEGYLEFYLVRVDEGRLTPMLWALKPGDRLHLGENITGHFTLEDVAPNRTIIAVATGTGLAPFRGMYQTYKNANRWKRFVLLESCRYARDCAYFDEFKQCETEDERLIYLPTVTRETGDWPGLRGRVMEHLQPDAFEKLTGETLSPDTCEIFLCGNPAMVDDCEEKLNAQGFITHGRNAPQGTLHLERYW